MEQYERDEADPDCPLHGTSSSHAKEDRYHSMMRRYKILPSLQMVAGDDGHPDRCIVTAANPDPESDEEVAFEVEGATKDVLNFFDTGSGMVRAVMISRGEPDPHIYVKRDEIAEFVRKNFWNMAELHGERAPEELAAMIASLVPEKDQEHQ